MSLKVLNLFAGIGGNRKLWDCFKMKITAVENDPIIAEIYQERFPNDKVIIQDAYAFVEENYRNYDIIWSSPPCKSHTRMRKFPSVPKILPDLRLYSLIIFLENFFPGNFIVENVDAYYKPLIRPQRIDRHCIWSNKRFDPWNKESSTYGFWRKTFDELAEILEINQEIKEKLRLVNPKHPEQALRNCVCSELGKKLMRQLLIKKQPLKIEKFMIMEN